MMSGKDKIYTEKEINNALRGLMKEYAILYENGMMTFQEWSVIENVFIKINTKFGWYDD